MMANTQAADQSIEVEEPQGLEEDASASPDEGQVDGLNVSQEWEGYVVSIEDDAFVAQLVDLTAGRTYAGEEAIIPLDQVSEHDAANMSIGSVFRWVIGYVGSPGETRKSVSQIVFLDLGKMTEDDLRTGREWADKIARALSP